MSDGGCSICYTIRHQTKSDVAASIIELQFVLRLPIIDHLLGVIGFYLKWNWLLWPLGALLWYHWLASSVHWLPLSVIGLLENHIWLQLCQPIKPSERCQSKLLSCCNELSDVITIGRDSQRIIYYPWMLLAIFNLLPRRELFLRVVSVEMGVIGYNYPGLVFFLTVQWFRISINSNVF